MYEHVIKTVIIHAWIHTTHVIFKVSCSLDHDKYMTYINSALVDIQVSII